MYGLTQQSAHSRIAGFSLVEVAVAVGVCASALLIILGLMSVGLRTDATSGASANATNLMTSILADLRNTTGATGISPRYSIDLSKTTSTLYFPASNSSVSSSNPSAIYLASLWVQPLTSAPQKAYSVRLCVSWPASAGLAHYQGVSEVTTVIRTQ